ncbi:hypothetical protein HDU93_004766, partial [Gonapodya sp. JEL0774]
TKSLLHPSLNPLVLSGAIRPFSYIRILSARRATNESFLPSKPKTKAKRKRGTNENQDDQEDDAVPINGHVGPPKFWIIEAVRVEGHGDKVYVDVEGCKREHGGAAPEG